jgi:signal transduction histidine kinase
VAVAALQCAERELLDGLQRAAASATCPLALDAARRIVGPFALDSAPAAAPAPIGIAEQAAGAHAARGELAAALSFFAHAAEVGTLSPEGWLRYSDLLAADDLAAAQRALETARAQHGTARCGHVPFVLLAALREARWLARTDAQHDARRRELVDIAFTAARTVPAGAVPALAAALREALPTVDGDPRRADLLAAASAAGSLGATPVAAVPAAGPDGSVLVPRGEDRMAVLPGPAAAEVVQTAIARAGATQPTVAVRAAGGDAPANAPSFAVPALGARWIAVPTAVQTSALLSLTARTCLALAVATFVFGNLLVLRLVRRELALVRLRRDFVDVVSHELRTPLAALSLKAEMLARGDVPAGRTPHYLHGLHADVARLVEQVERILDFGRLERGAPLRRQTVPARELLARGLRAGRPALRLVGQALEVEVPRQLPRLVGDVEVLGRALRNLLENAAKYAPPGSTVTVRAFADGGHLQVEVMDRGPGVPAVERATIFQPFVRGGGAANGTPGSGLGLALVAAAAKAHGGEIAVHDRDGGGAVFTLTLPVQQEAAS